MNEYLEMSDGGLTVQIPAARGNDADHEFVDNQIRAGRL